MALTPMGDFTFNHLDNVDRPNKSATQMKADFDTRGAELKTALNAIVTKLNAVTDGNSGADNVAATAIDGWIGATVQAILESAKTDVDGKIPKTLLSAQGDIIYSSAANTPARLAKGTAGQVLEMNVGATAPQWGNTKLDAHLANTATFHGGVAWAAWTPTLTWTTATPTSIATVARSCRIGKMRYFIMYIASSDGKGATGLTITLPEVAVGSNYPVVSGLQMLDSVYSTPKTYVDTDAGLIKFVSFGTLTDTKTWGLQLTGFYEVA